MDTMMAFSGRDRQFTLTRERLLRLSPRGIGGAIDAERTEVEARVKPEQVRTARSYREARRGWQHVLASFTGANIAEGCYRQGESSGISAIAKATGLTRQTIYRIKDDPAAAEASLTAWSDRPFDVAA
jgi:hypothetical protein